MKYVGPTAVCHAFIEIMLFKFLNNCKPVSMQAGFLAAL
jgi:hypothetical protein